MIYSCMVVKSVLRKMLFKVSQNNKGFLGRQKHGIRVLKKNPINPYSKQQKKTGYECFYNALGFTECLSVRHET